MNLSQILNKLSHAHKSRFKNIRNGDHVQVTDYQGQTYSGKIENITDGYFSINNEANVAGGYNQTVGMTWVEVIEMTKL